MTHRETIIQLLRSRKRVTLLELFEAGVGYEARSRISELRGQGWIITHHKHNPELGQTASDNYWELESEPVSITFAPSGQGEMIFQDGNCRL